MTEKRFRIQMVGRDQPAPEYTDSPTAARTEAHSLANLYRHQAVMIVDRQEQLVFFITAQALAHSKG